MNQYAKHCLAVEKLDSIVQNPQNHIIVHYSCEGFSKTHGGHSARITSIALYDIAGQQTHSFSLHLAAEEMGINLDDMDDSYNQVEHYMLRQYFDFLSQCRNKKYIHWNMLDANYGFLALEHRYLVLSKTYRDGERLIRVPDNDKINLAAILKDKYGDNYADDPRMASLIEMNDMKPLHFLNGKEEAQAFEEKNYIGLSLSTSCKVRVFSDIIYLAESNRLKTKATLREMYGISVQGVYGYLKTKWVFAIIVWAITILISAYAGNNLFR